MKEFNLEHEAKGVVSNYVDEMLFYLEEFGKGDKLKMEKIANAFCEEYKKVFYSLINEILEED